MSELDWKSIEGSSNVAAIAHDGTRIHTRFHNGGHYSHEGTAEEFTRYLAAPSKGKYFHQTLRSRPHQKHG